MSDQGESRRPTRRVATARYVVYVDRQPKNSYDSRELADVEANRIRNAFPILNVGVTDSHHDSIAALMSATLRSAEKETEE